MAYKMRLESLNLKMLDFFEILIKEGKQVFRYSKSGYITTILFLLIAFILGVILAVILYQMSKSTECFNCKRCAKIMLSIKLVFVLLSIIFSFILMVSDASLGGFCKLIQELNENDFLSLKSYKPEIDIDIYNLLDTCYNKNSKEDMFSLLKTEQTSEFRFQEIGKILTGVSGYDLFQSQKDEITANFTQQINNLENDYRNRSEGIIYDHFNVTSSLKELNNEIDCSDTKFQLNTDSC